LLSGQAGLGSAYALVFGLEAVAFVVAACIAMNIRIGGSANRIDARTDTPLTDENKNSMKLIPRMEGSD
jgi:hypothetical protein